MNADYIGRETTETILGQQWTFARSDRAIDREFAEYARTVLPDPIEAMTRNLDKVALKDAVVLRQLQIDDNAELAKATKENRPAILMGPQYVPFADTMTKQAINKAACYLGFGSPEVQSVMSSTEGISYLWYLLLRKHHPDVTPDKAHELMTALGERAAAIITRCRGRAEPTGPNGQAPAV